MGMLRVIVPCMAGMIVRIVTPGGTLVDGIIRHGMRGVAGVIIIVCFRFFLLDRLLAGGMVMVAGVIMMRVIVMGMVLMSMVA